MGASLNPKQIKRRDRYLRYRIEGDGFDWSDQAFLDHWSWESRGEKMPSRDKANGFLFAQRAESVTKEMWKEDIASGLLTVGELVQDGYSAKDLRVVTNGR